MRRFYAPEDSFRDGGVNLDEEQTRHLRNVLRLREGAKVHVFDGAGREFLCSIREIGKRSATLDIVQLAEPASPESGLDLTIAAAILKGEKFDLVVQKLVELGVKRLVPLITLRSDVRPKDAEKKLGRWRKIALEAAKQSGRATMMVIDHPMDIETFLESAGSTNLAVFSERDGGKLEALDVTSEFTAVIGPEGGWDDAELALIANQNIPAVTIGGRILRAETAAIVIAAILQHRFGDLN